MLFKFAIVFLAAASNNVLSVRAACLPTNTNSGSSLIQSRLSGKGAVVQLCPGSLHLVSRAITFTAADQEISTEGYPNTTARAKILLVGSTDKTLINGINQNGVRLLNVQVSGSGTPGSGGPALILMGGAVSNQTISRVIGTSPAGASALEVQPGSNSVCSGVKITYNAFTNNARHDGFPGNGIKITYPTNVGIVIAGGPGTQVLDNLLNASYSEVSNAGITLVDNDSGGNYSNVVVARNYFTAVSTGLFNIGIAIGSRVWKYNAANFGLGPLTVTNNVFVGSIGFSIVINGWSRGLTVTGNDISRVTSPSYYFADASDCPIQQVKNSFNANQQLIAYQPNILGAKTLQPNFVSIGSDANNWVCLRDRNSRILRAGDPSISAANGGVIAELNGGSSLRGVRVYIQNDGNVVAYRLNPDGSPGSVAYAVDKGSKYCGSDGSACYISCQGDGNLVEYDARGVVWASDTANRGATCVFLNSYPGIQVKDASGAVIWQLQH